MNLVDFFRSNCHPPDQPVAPPAGFLFWGRGGLVRRVASQTSLFYAFFDGQNLFNAAKEAFGYDWPNYDPLKLATAICRIQGWKLERIHFYTGIPEPADPRHSFWNKKLQVMGTRGVQVFTRPLRYREKITYSKDSAYTIGRVPTEKGIDVRLALDVVRFAHEDLYDVALIFSQDQDLSEPSMNSSESPCNQDDQSPPRVPFQSAPPQETNSASSAPSTSESTNRYTTPVSTRRTTGPR
jgi:uncharacterized LabA/DUF88 family protein